MNVYSNFIFYRSRRQDEEAWFVARRRDRLRKVDEQWRLARRHIVLDHHVFLDENISVFMLAQFLLRWFVRLSATLTIRHFIRHREDELMLSTEGRYLTVLPPRLFFTFLQITCY